MKKKSSVHVIQIITKLELGGAQKVCLALMEGLGKGATLISGGDGVLVSQTQKFKSVYLLDSLKREVGLRAIINEIRAFFSLIRILKKLKKEYSNCVVHTHSTKAGILGRWAALFAGIRNKVSLVRQPNITPYNT